MLKAMSLDINNEVKSQNRLLDSMGGILLTYKANHLITNLLIFSLGSFMSASDLFKNTIGKITTMVQSGGSNNMYYLVGCIVFVFLLLYFMMGRK